MGVAGRRFSRLKRTLIGPAAVVAVLEELPFICAGAVVIGSLIMSVTALWMSLPQ